MKPEDGGQAFPYFYVWDRERREQIAVDPGMTLRDWFAGQAVIGLLAGANAGDVRVAREAGTSVWAAVATYAYAAADALLAQRKEN